MFESRGRSSAAQALVEFALVLPLMTMLCLGVVQLVLYAHALDVVAGSVQEGARLAAEDGRGLDEGLVRAHALLTAGVGETLDHLQMGGSMDAEIVSVRVDTALRPILPLPVAGGLPIHAEARVARERFRPGGR
jgi:hypothetical protein